MSEFTENISNDCDEDQDVAVELLEALLEANEDEEGCINDLLKADDMSEKVIGKVEKNDDVSCIKENISTKEILQSKTSFIHGGDTDSSEDEDNRYSMESKYSEYGRNIKHMLVEKDTILKEKSLFGNQTPQNTGSLWKPKNKVDTTKLFKTELTDVYTDPVFGMRIKNPLVTSKQLQERMVGRNAIPLARVKYHIKSGDIASDWVIGGVIVKKSSIKTSQKGSQYCIWKVSDLKDGLKTVSVFLFRNSHKTLWKTAIGTVVGILNPNIMESRDDGEDEGTVSVDNSQKVMILGISRDYGICKSRKKNGDNCTAFVNINKCEYCIYHVQQEYKKCSRRSELQSPNLGQGHIALRNKVLGKNEVFYGGQSFMASPARVNRKQVAKDNQRLRSLSDSSKHSPNLVQTKLSVIGDAFKYSPSMNETKLTASKGSASRIDLSRKQALKDHERLLLLRKENPMVLCEMKNSKSKDYIAEVTNEKPRNKSSAVDLKGQPQLGKSGVSILNTKSQSCESSVMSQISKPAVVDLSVPIQKSHINRAKLNAVQWVQRNGPMNKINPNDVKKNRTEVAKRRLENEPTVPKKGRKLAKLDPSNIDTSSAKAVLSAQFQKLLETKSRYTELIEASDNQAQEQYFNLLEKREKLEEKMLTTFKVDCKAVRCFKCKYTSFSASDMCKSLGHPLKVIDAVKRFFRCHDCGNRTVSLELIPLLSCKQCGGSQWQRAPMMKERKEGTPIVPLSIRGGEGKFIGSLQSDGNMSLLVPDE